MINIIIKPTKKVVVVNSYCNSADSVGVIGENNATSIEFSFPDYIEGVSISEFEKEFVWKHARDSGRTAIVNDRLKLNSNHTQCANLTFQVRLLHDNIEWKTIPKTFKLADTLALPDEDKMTYDEWLAFCAELTTLLNSNFAAGLTEGASVEEITAALSAAEINESARAELIQTINQHFDAEIPENATVAEIVEYINAIQTAAETRAVIITAINTKFSTDIPTDATEQETIAAISGIENGAREIDIRPYEEVFLNA